MTQDDVDMWMGDTRKEGKEGKYMEERLNECKERGVKSEKSYIKTRNSRFVVGKRCKQRKSTEKKEKQKLRTKI